MFTPRLNRPHSAAPRSARRRGIGIRNAATMPNSTTDASASRIVAAQTGGVASLPKRIARNVVPQMRAQLTNVIAMRMLTTLERPSAPGREVPPNVAKDAELPLDQTVRRLYISGT